MSLDHARAQLLEMPALPLVTTPTPVEELARLRAALGGGPRLLIKRDDLIGFGFGGNKVRKLALVGARARDAGADTLISTGGLQSNHARVTAAVAAALGMKCALVLNGDPAAAANGNARLREWLGAEAHYVRTRAERSPAMAMIAEKLSDQGHRPFIVPLGASTPIGALGYARAIGELLGQVPPPDVIVHATSSGGTQAGIITGCALHGLRTRVIGVSADEPAASLAATVGDLVAEISDLLGTGTALAEGRQIDVDADFVGRGYGVPTEESDAAMRLLARTEGVFLDPVYTAKAMAGLLAYLRAGQFTEEQTVLFWHTGGLPGIFA